MTGFAYLAALGVALAGLATLDRRYRLAFWSDARRAAVCVAVGVVLFLLWDLAGLALGIFARGESPHMTGLLLAPELPVEELVFLTLLCYNALLAWRGLDLWTARRRGSGPGTPARGGSARGGSARDGSARDGSAPGRSAS